jgi:SAM-dependent methyltransferase
MKCLNLTCGPVYLLEDHLINIDFQAVGSEVRGHDLLTPLPFRDNEFDLVYCSHFFEDNPRVLVYSFLAECKRVLKPGDISHLVLPDSEEMFATYLDLRSKGLHPEADFVMIEIIDQRVRAQGGGELGAFYSRISLMDPSQQAYWNSFIAHRNGRTLEVNLSEHKSLPHPPRSQHNLIILLSTMLGKVKLRFRHIAHRLGLKLLLPAFKRQNVSFASIGEKHCWLWDFHQLKAALELSGFSAVCRQSHILSQFSLFPFFPLDATANGMPRKGKESIYVEASFHG